MTLGMNNCKSHVVIDTSIIEVSLKFYMENENDIKAVRDNILLTLFFGFGISWVVLTVIMDAFLIKGLVANQARNN